MTDSINNNNNNNMLNNCSLSINNNNTINNCSLVNEIIEETIDENGTKIIIKKQIYNIYTTYTQAHKKANKKYVENNKEKVIQYRTEYGRKRYQEDPLFREKVKEAVKRCREKKKMDKL